MNLWSCRDWSRMRKPSMVTTTLNSKNCFEGKESYKCVGILFHSKIICKDRYCYQKSPTQCDPYKNAITGD